MLHYLQLHFTFSIPPHPPSSHFFPFISSFLYIYLIGFQFAYTLLPFFLRYRACKAIGLRYKELKVSPIIWLAIVLLLLAIGYVVWFGNQL